MRDTEKKFTTPKLVGDEFLDGGLWGRGLWGVWIKKTTLFFASNKLRQ